MLCESCTTVCWPTALRYLPNFVGVVILITLYIGLFRRTFGVLANCHSPMVKGSKTESANATEALLQTEIPYCTAEGAHTVAETLLEARAAEMATCVLGAQSKKKHRTVPLSNIKMI